ncbi:MAG: CusA/CzcA family heavy metal efflux RND transporter [Ignavibacteria bacterium]|jgi:cobalt-zinc-cadmium resistance protein CzcA|nr:CusA/CzcA family heavy metal efflux RND transporter [Ignavibacteria bacterium]
MIDKLIAFSIKQKIVIGFFVLLLIIFGAYSAVKLPIDAVPDITNNQVQIITSSPTLSATEVERFITYPIEISLANTPKLVELRSISKLGVSVVTAVFEDNVDIYFARNLIFQKLQEAQENIPGGLAKPELAPISTGLGEIYQYVVRPEKTGDTTFSDMDLRTIQDWIVKRQLLGTEGVAEVNSFGGYEKQFQILINPDALKSFNLSLREVFEAVNNNNANVGGSFIEHNSEQYAIRGIGIIENKNDIDNIVVKSFQGIPVYLSQVAEVKEEGGIRYGSVTQDGKGEVVAGIVMMLKGANSREVASTVHKKIEQVKTTLPKGVTIDEFYNREDLVDRAIATVEKNLIEGAIIVIFVLVLLLGNLRAGFIVASVIPLSMLFALIMMNLFGVSGNLMSLGAIDFGLIVDGAVIIVESVIVAISHAIHKHKRSLYKDEMQDTIFKSTAGIIKSAIFGIIIIIVVYLPIFALGGIEGKMFKPMAFTVGFALIGALLLSLTYVPMMSDLILKRDMKEKENISDKIINFLKRLYIPSLKFALRKKALILISAIAVLALSVLMFIRLGGEFIPKLDEGDIAYQIARLPGISLKESQRIGTICEQILMKKFPEIKTVVTKTGAAEIATDPMGVEFSDVLVMLKPKSEWKSASSKEELIEMMQKELSIVPGIGLSFTQPIELRFNELISGAKGDVAVKIFGEDLSELSKAGNDVSKIMSGILGAEDISVQQLEGLPQLQIKIKRDRIARYGINVSDVNEIIEAGLAGKTAGAVFEGDKKFDLVVKYLPGFRQDVEGIRNILINSHDGLKIPLNELAEIKVEEGPAEITRDNGKRRIVIQCNVRGRDIESFVKELQTNISKELKVPPGYAVEYGGQFKNLESAKERLYIAVPVSLFFIFALLFVTFNSVKQGLLVFSGIPFAVVGGIFALVVRDIPFSISAGVGFIALFGVAVLNGIVMIAYFNKLEKEGQKDLNERILNGTSARLRPILMTALVASLGFIPMAISTGSGAEVQKPLATVVIGGLISSTLLTLIVLPVLYSIFNKKSNFKMSSHIKPTVILFFLFLPAVSFSQTDNLQQFIDAGVQNNSEIQALRLNVEKEEAGKKKSVNIPKPQLFLEYEGVKGGLENFESRKIGISQELEFPSVYFMRSDVQSVQIEIAKAELQSKINSITAEIKKLYFTVAVNSALIEIAKDNVRLSDDFLNIAERKRDAGFTTSLDVMNAKVNKTRTENELRNLENEFRKSFTELRLLLHSEGTELKIQPDTTIRYYDIQLDDLLKSAMQNNPDIRLSKLRKEQAENKISLAKSLLLPNLSLKYYNQKLGGESGYYGFEVGVGIPIWFFLESSGDIQQANVEKKITDVEEDLTARTVQTDVRNAFEDFLNNKRQSDFINKDVLEEARQILTATKRSYEEGVVSYTDFLQAMRTFMDVQSTYVRNWYNYKNSLINLEKLTGRVLK